MKSGNSRINITQGYKLNPEKREFLLSRNVCVETELNKLLHMTLMQSYFIALFVYFSLAQLIYLFQLHYRTSKAMSIFLTVTSSSKSDNFENMLKIVRKLGQTLNLPDFWIIFN